MAQPPRDDAAPPAPDTSPAGGTDSSGDDRVAWGLSRKRDPGDGVPPGVAPEYPAPLTEEDKKVLERLRELPQRAEKEEGEPDRGES